MSLLEIYLIGLVIFLMGLGVQKLYEERVSTKEFVLVILLNWILIIYGTLRLILQRAAYAKVRRDFGLKRGHSFPAYYLQAYGVSYKNDSTLSYIKILWRKRDDSKIDEKHRKKLKYIYRLKSIP